MSLTGANREPAGITVGQGYTFGDADYWQYLLKLADWKVSAPYYHTGVMPAQRPYSPASTQ